MSPSIHKAVSGERGRRTTRSTDDRISRSAATNLAVCPSCHLLHRGNRWQVDEEAALQLLAVNRSYRLICPACRRSASNTPAGIVTLSGRYLEENWQVIQNLIRHTVADCAAKDPLGRIMSIDTSGGVTTISTTQDKVAQKIGRVLFRAHKGELLYSWNQDQRFVRVTWNR